MQALPTDYDCRGNLIPGSSNLSRMPTCADCFLYQPAKKGGEGECRINGPAPPDRDAERCPSRTFRPR